MLPVFLANSKKGSASFAPTQRNHFLAFNSHWYNPVVYDPPLSVEEIKKKYSADLVKKLLNDPIHNWRALTGIELIHKEPTLVEQVRIWHNWQKMDLKQKRKSDTRSLELFGITNEKHHKQIMNEALRNSRKIPFPNEYKKALVEGKKNTTVRVEQEVGRYSQGGIYEATSYSGKKWGVLIEIKEVKRASKSDLRELNLPWQTRKKITKELESQKSDTLEVITFKILGGPLRNVS